MAGSYWEWSGVERGFYSDLERENGAISSDRYMQALYDAALFDHSTPSRERGPILEALRDYMWDEYGLDFDDVYDWDGYRDAYDTAQV